MNIRQLNHVALHVSDLDRSRKFYGEVLGLEPMDRPAFDFPGAWFRVGADQEVHLIGRPPATGLPPHERHFAFRVDSIRAAKARLVELGVDHRGPKPRPDGALQIFLRDPDAHEVELFEGPGGASPGAVVPSLAPWLSVRDGPSAVEFCKAAFGAVEVYRMEDPGGGLVSRLSVDGAEFWISAEPAERAGPSPPPGGGSVRMILVVPDPDAVFARALAAGASEVFPVSEGHGWRVGRLEDPSGHHWEIGRPVDSPGSSRP